MTEEAHIRIFCVDDHPLAARRNRVVIQNQSDMMLVAHASNGQEGVQQFRKHRPDVTLMDVRLPDRSGINAIIAIRTEFPAARVIVLTTFEGDVEIRMPPKELIDVVRQVHAGKKRIPD